MKKFVIVFLTAAWVLLSVALVTLGTIGGFVVGGMTGIAFITIGYGILCAYIAGSRYYFRHSSKIKRFAIITQSIVWLLLVGVLGVTAVLGGFVSGAMAGIAFLSIGHGLLIAYIGGSARYFRD